MSNHEATQGKLQKLLQLLSELRSKLQWWFRLLAPQAPLFFAVLYASISWVNHFVFRTFALDLGAYTNAMWDYAHFRWNDSLAFKAEAEHLLADHFDLYLMLFSPLVWIFGTYTLLVVQVFFLVWGGITVKKLLLFRGKGEDISLAGMWMFYLFFGVYAALSFDYHSNVVAACALPAFMLALHQKRMGKAWLWLGFMLIGKENMSLWLLFVCLGLVLEFYRERKMVFQLSLMALTSAVWFVLVTGFIMPAFSNAGAYPHLHYAVLGKTSGEALKFMLSHPMEAIALLFSNHSGNPEADCVKPEFITLMAIAGLPLLLKRPGYLIMMVPLVFQKFYHNDYYKWGIYAQYAIEFAPIMAIGVMEAISTVENHKLKKLLLGITLLGSAAGMLHLMQPTCLWEEKNRLRFYSEHHYKRHYPIALVKEQLDRIPPEAIVSTQSSFQPYLSLRDKVYHFPVINDAEYVVISTYESPWPISSEELREWMRKLDHSQEWERVATQSWIRIYKRKS